MKIYMLRHGETDWNIEGRLQGRMDIPMNESGKEQTKAIGQFLKDSGFCVGRIISSPLLRAKQTTEIISKTIDFG